jgi:PAS domain S-box-containing protein
MRLSQKLARREDDERMRFALAAAHMGVFEWDVNSDGMTWPGTTGLGLKPEEAPTCGRAFFDLVHPDDRHALGANRDRALRDRTDAVSAFRTISSDGAVHWVQAHGHIVYDADGEPLRVLGVNSDITYRKSLDEQILETHDEVERLKVLKATMRTVQHIVNNALMSLHMFRAEVEGLASQEALALFDQTLLDTAARLKVLGDLDRVVETQMEMGSGIEYPSCPPARMP